MRAALVAALFVLQPEPSLDGIKGVVLREDGSRAAGAVVRVVCGTWEQTTTASSDGSFRVAGVPAASCTLTAAAAEDPSAGFVTELPPDRTEAVSVILSRGLRDGRSARGTGVTIDLRAPTTPGNPAPRFGAMEVTGTASWSSGLAPWDPTARPDQWSVGITATRPGPWGTLFSGTVTSRRQVGPSTLLTDVTGVSAGDPTSGALLANPSPSSLVWDARLGLQKTFTRRGVDLTIFGEGYRSFQSEPAEGAAGLPLSPDASKALRTGGAARFGIKIGF